MSKRRILNRSLMHMAARLHYIDGLSQRDVARKLDISTASTSRVLARAREEGIVQIHVAEIVETDYLGAELCAALGLRAASVCDAPRAIDLSYRVGELLKEGGLPDRPVIALGWGRAVQRVIEEGLPRIPDSSIVPAIGGMEETASHFQINEFVRLAAQATGGRALFLHAPSMASAELRGVLQRDERICKILEYWPAVDATIQGIGAVSQSSHVGRLEFSSGNRADIVGDVARRYFDIDGRDAPWVGEDDLMAISRADLRRAPLSIGIATGKDKVSAILGAVRSGMVNALVTDDATAAELLGSLGSEISFRTKLLK